MKINRLYLSIIAAAASVSVLAACSEDKKDAAPAASQSQPAQNADSQKEATTAPAAQDNKSLSEKAEETKEKAEDKADRKSTRLNSSHVAISYAVFCLKKKK